jgi:hypothetical protein
MPRYMSHIYAKPTQELLSFLQLHPLLSTGLFYIRQSASDEVKGIIRDGLTNNGLVIVREVCDPLPNYQNEAEAHKSTNAPVLSWWKLQGKQDVQVIPPNHIPTLGFGTIYDNYETNPPPPIEFLRFLKHLSVTYKTTIAFYHHYTAFEDSLADCEYAWVFGKQDFVYIRHVDEPYKTVLYTADDEPQIIHDKYTKDQPILHFIMQKFGVSLAQSSARSYFSDFDWERYRFGTRTPLTESSQHDTPQSPNMKTLNTGKRNPHRYSDKRRVKSQGLKVSSKSDLPEANRDLDLHGIIAALGDRALHSTWVGSGIECFGENAEELYSFTDHNRSIAGYDLLRVTKGIYQTIEGDFKAFDQGLTSHWFFIRAWDGSGFYIETNDPEIKERLKNQFQAVEDIKETQPPYEGLFIPCYH